MRKTLCRLLMMQDVEGSTMAFGTFSSTLVALLAGAALSAQVLSHKVVPLNRIPSEQWIEVVSGDPEKRGVPFVLRIHNDAGYVCPPHTHPTDENIVVVKGSWSVGMGTRVNLSSVQPLEMGAYALVPSKMAHFCRSKTETIIQVHGVGPFSVDMVDPLYELTPKGVNRMMSLGAPEQIVRDYPASCFTFTIGDRVSGSAGEGTVVGAQCSAASGFTQYWVQKGNGERFWATAQELRRA
jgi:quercetin dioxygenase-like cupin family protein